jgi:hypothetical protein
VNRLSHRTRRLARALIIFTAALLLTGVATAAASPDIEGIWSFNGGQIGVQHTSNGSYVGIVVAETKFAECAHPVGQKIWTNIVEQPDGSFHGLHQWYLVKCKENPVLGPTAWRILTAADGSHYLRVCFSHPGTSQPLIAANGDPKEESEYASFDVTYGCTNSSLTAPLPPTPGAPNTSASGNPGASAQGKGGSTGLVESLTLPGSKRCLGGKRFVIRLKDPKYDPLKTVTITLHGHKLATSRDGSNVVAKIKLSRPLKGPLTIEIHATTVLGHHLSAHRTYHLCSKMKPKRGRKKG